VNVATARRRSAKGERLFFTSSSIGPEVPLENVTFAYGHIRDYDPTTPRPNAGKWRPWPWPVRDD